MIAGADEDAADGADVLEVASEGYGDMLAGGEEVVCGVEVDPAEVGQEGGDPGMGGIGSGEFGLAGGRECLEVAADVAGGETD